MRVLSTDIETYSSVGIQKSGLYKYAQSPDFEILLFVHVYNDNPVRVVDLVQGEKIPYFMAMDLHRPEVMKTVFNVVFEYYCLSKFSKIHLEQWQCTMIHAWYCGYAGGLDVIGRAMELPEDKWKLLIDKPLIKYSCTPCARTKRSGGRTRNFPEHAPDKRKLFKEYRGQDVVTEREIKNRLTEYPVPALEHQLRVIDRTINIGRVALDTVLIDGVLAINAQITEELTEKVRDITGPENPNSVAQLKQWAIDNADVGIESLNKQTVAGLLAQESGTDDIQVMLRVRQEMAKTSVKRYQVMQDVLYDDGRVRGLLQFYGACRTGRWAGRLVQVQNLLRNYIDSLGAAGELIREQKVDALRVIYGNVPDTFPQLIHTASIPEDGYMFAVADFSAIEARVIAWLAGEGWCLEVFWTYGKIYEASVSTTFGVSMEKIRKGNLEYALRSRGKVAELALGYQGAVGALIQTGALRTSLHEEELPDIVQRWRASNKRIVDLWYSIKRYVAECVEYGVTPSPPDGTPFSGDANQMMITSSSGRKLFYLKPRMIPGGRSYKRIYFTGQNQESHKWDLLSAYGGKLTENIVQAVARDCLANAMVSLYTAGYRINFHIHDEVILEIPKGGRQNLEEAISLMCRPPAWAERFPLSADGFTEDYYKREQVYVRERQENQDISRYEQESYVMAPTGAPVVGLRPMDVQARTCGRNLCEV